MTDFIVVRSAHQEEDGVHIIIPTDFIMSVAPLFKRSEVLDEAFPVRGKTLINMKSHKGLEVYDTLENIMKALNAKMVTEGEVQVTMNKLIDLSASITAVDRSK